MEKLWKPNFRRIILLCNFVVVSLSLSTPIYCESSSISVFIYVFVSVVEMWGLFREPGLHEIIPWRGLLSDPFNITGLSLVQSVFIYQESESLQLWCNLTRPDPTRVAVIWVIWTNHFRLCVCHDQALLENCGFILCSIFFATSRSFTFLVLLLKMGLLILWELVVDGCWWSLLVRMPSSVSLNVYEGTLRSLQWLEMCNLVVVWLNVA